jgi:hypothetical protein
MILRTGWAYVAMAAFAPILSGVSAARPLSFATFTRSVTNTAAMACIITTLKATA